MADINSAHYYDNLKFILVNLYLHGKNRKKFASLFNAIDQYILGNEEAAIQSLIIAIDDRPFDRWRANYILTDSKNDILARGGDVKNNDYLKLTLKKYLNKYGQIGSFELWPAVHSYLRLALHLKNKIDLGSIYKFWFKYHQRRDYSLSAIDEALTVFEQKKWVSWPSSVKFITEIQEQSEKGYRGLFAGYIMEHNPEFILTILKEFSYNHLKIDWFSLEAPFLDVIPDELYRFQRHKLFSYHNSDRKIPADDIINLLPSNKYALIKRDLKQFGYKAHIKENDPDIAILEQYEIPFEVYKDQHAIITKTDPEKQFYQGIIDLKSAELIKLKKLRPAEVAGFSDGYYTALAEPNLFRQFSKARIKREFKDMLFHGITAKSKLSDYHHSPWALPGSILKIMSDNGINLPKQLFNSFLQFLKLSLIDFEPKVKN